jgi:iron(III) transport system permease protein
VLVVPAVVAAAVCLLPLPYLVLRAGDGGLSSAVEVVWREQTLQLVLRSLGLAATVTLTCLVIGTALAVLTVRTTMPGRRIWAVVAALPLAVPSYVAAYAWVSAVPEVSGFGGAVLVLTACTYPYVYLPVAAALALADPAQEEVARSLGRGRVAVLREVVLPQVTPAAAGGALLVALYVLSDFGAVSILRFDAFTRVIHSSYRASFDRTPAAVLSLLLVAVTLLVTVAEARTRRRVAVAPLGSGVARRAKRWELSSTGSVLATVACATVAGISIGFPLASLVSWVRRSVAGTDLDLTRLAEAATWTLWVSTLGALAAVLLAVPVGVLTARYRGAGPRLLEQATFAGHAVPGVVVALSLVFLGIGAARPLYQETPLLVVAYAVLFLPLAVGTVRAAVCQSAPAMEDVARSLGHSPAAVLRRVTLPLAGPGIAAGAALVMLTCMRELPATLMLQPTGSETLATRLWSQTRVGAYAGAAPYAAMLVLLAVIPTWWLIRSQDRLLRTDAAPPPSA